MYKVIETILGKKAEQIQLIGRKVLCRNLYVEAFDHRIAEVQMNPIFGIEGVREKIMSALTKKKDGYFQEILIDIHQIEDLNEWLQEQIDQANEMDQTNSRVVTIREKLMQIELDVLKYMNELELQKSYLENLSF
jgi:hypothetical protein